MENNYKSPAEKANNGHNEGLLRLSSVIENAPYMLSRELNKGELKFSGSSYSSSGSECECSSDCGSDCSCDCDCGSDAAFTSRLPAVTLENSV